MAWCVRSCRGRRTGHRDKGSPGTWEVLRSPRSRPVGHRLINSRPARAHSTATGTKPECHQWYRQAKATKRGGKDRRTSEHLVVPTKQGNRRRRDPGEGRGCQVMELLEGNMAGASKPAPTDCGPTPNAEPEMSWPLCLLRNHRQQLCVVAVPSGGGPHLAEMV